MTSASRHPHHLSARRLLAVLGLAVFAGFPTAGCLATRGYVDEQVTESEVKTEERVDEIESQVETNQDAIAEHGERIEQQERRIDEMSDTSREALARAIAAGKLAEGKLLYETVLTDNKVQFGLDAASLSEGAKTALDDFAENLKQENANVYLEIQGHTDSSGVESYNLELGERRAEAVRTYLSMEHGIPLHRMSVISYGEERPIADNSTAEGRSQNRRVTVVVLK